MTRLSYVLLTVTGAALLAACGERSAPTSQSYRGTMAGIRGSRDTTGLPSQYAANGATADVNWYSYIAYDSGGGGGGGGFSNGSIYAARTNAVSDEWTYVSWYIYSCALMCTYSNGYGYVPGAVLSGVGGSDLHLKFNPADYPGAFYVYGDSLGPVDLTWRPNGMYSSRTTGTSEYQYPGFRFHSNGVSETAQAAVTGTVNGAPIPTGASANMGTNHSVTISIYH